MLMMLAGLGAWCRDSAADAHDAGRVGGFGEVPAQLMLMMLAGVGGLGIDIAQLMRIC